MEVIKDNASFHLLAGLLKKLRYLENGSDYKASKLEIGEDWNLSALNTNMV